MTTPQTFRKKPVEIQAIQFTGNFNELEQFVGGDAEFRRASPTSSRLPTSPSSAAKRCMVADRLRRRPPLTLRPRRIAQFLAWLTRYFWTPCPLCGKAFAGFEWRTVSGHLDSIPTGRDFSSQAICPTCTAAGRGCTAWRERGHLPRLVSSACTCTGRGR
jgi:hypothetical protein